VGAAATKPIISAGRDKQGQSGFEAATQQPQPKKNTSGAPTQNPYQTKDMKNNPVLDNESHET
jgi:hypothetical protein